VLVFARPFVKWFALCYRSIVCPVLSVMFLHCGQTVGRIKMKLGLRVGLGPGHILLDGDPAPLPERGRSPQVLAHFCCGQMAAVIKMPLGTEVRLGPGDCVRWGPRSPLPDKGAEPPPQFSTHFYCDQTAGCIKMALGMEVGLISGDLMLDGDPAAFRKRGQSPLPNFWLMSIAATRLDGSRCHLVRR